MYLYRSAIIRLNANISPSTAGPDTAHNRRIQDPSRRDEIPGADDRQEDWAGI